MRAGPMRQRITILAPPAIGSAADSFGQATGSPTTVGTYWAEVRPLAGRELVVAQQLRADVTHLVTLRRVPGIIATMQVLYRGRTLNITAVIDVDERRRQLDLYCTEPNAAGA